ncbi:MAG: hypothetical protein SFZ03_08450 [Candidatus Melainabacteria bacterium]|nr:hypothetical protein [Candidatus Melainabacteria bacterium]
MLGQIAAGNQLMEIQNGGSDSYSHTQVAGLAYSQTNDGNATVIVLDNVANGSQLELMGYTVTVYKSLPHTIHTELSTPEGYIYENGRQKDLKPHQPKSYLEYLYLRAQQNAPLLWINAPGWVNSGKFKTQTADE